MINLKIKPLRLTQVRRKFEGPYFMTDFGWSRGLIGLIKAKIKLKNNTFYFRILSTNQYERIDYKYIRLYYVRVVR